MFNLQTSLHKRIHFFRTCFCVIPALGMLLATEISQAPQARADGSSCDGPLLPYTCLYVYGSFTNVAEVGAVHVHAGSGKYCDYRADFAFYKSNGQRIGDIISDGNGGCAYIRPWVRINIRDIDVGPGGYVCTRWYENGAQHGGRTCHYPG